MNTIDFGKDTQLWLDRLACGELDERARQQLLNWLESEPLRWRACALALLEAQAWNESLETPAFPRANPVVQLPRKEKASPRLWSAAALAAALLVAFVSGAISRNWVKSNTEVAEGDKPAAGPLMATVSLKPALGPGVPATIQIPVHALTTPTPESGGINISEYDRQKWERRGYQLSKEKRFLPAELPDGKKVVVPVEQVKASYVGSKVS
jgi:hypothetical protein